MRIDRGRSLFARALAHVLRLPRAGDAVDTRLLVAPDAVCERWRRSFADRRLNTLQYEAADRLLAERFGLLELRFRLEVVDGSLLYRQVGAALVFGSMRVRVPARWAPTVTAREDPAGGRRTRVDVRIVLPALGAVLAYDGVIDFEGTAT